MGRKKKTNPRQDSVYGTVNVGEDRTLSIHYDPQTDELEIEGAEPGSTRTELSYMRETGKPKVVASIPSDGKSAFAAKDSLLGYDWVVAVDTNSRSLFGKQCGVCVSYFTPTPPAQCDKKVGIPFRVLAAYLIMGIREGVNPERIGWHLTLSRHLAALIHASQRVALVVDSELGLHRDINARTIGYYRDVMLPSHVTMSYSSSDSDNETLGGQMIRLCDKMSGICFAEIEKYGSLPDKHLPGNLDCDAIYTIPVRHQQQKPSQNHTRS